VQRLQEQINQQRRIMESHQDVARTWRIKLNEYRRQAQELADITIPARRGDLADARKTLDTVRRDTAHQLALHERRVEQRQWSLARDEATLRALRGE
jgi:hypothetical protein